MLPSCGKVRQSLRAHLAAGQGNSHMHILLGQFYSNQPTPAYDEIATALRASGHTVWIGTPNETGDILWNDGNSTVARQSAASPDWLNKRFIPRSVARRLNIFVRLRRVRRFIRQVRPDVVQINVANAFRWLPVLMPRPTRFILDVRQTNETHGEGLVGRAVSFLRNKSRGFYSRFIFDRTCFLHWAGAEHVLGPDWQRWATVVPMGVDGRFLSAKAGPADDRPRHGDQLRFIYVGRLSRRRLLERLIDASALVRRRTSGFKLVFVGHDQSEGYYQEYAGKLDLGDTVEFLPPVPYASVPDVLLQHDVALAYVPEQPADWQFHPTLKVLEYRALGMPIIATDFLPNRELIEDGINGLLIENTPESIAQAMLRFSTDPQFLADCRRHAQASREGVTWPQVAGQYEQLYAQLLAQRDTRQPATI